MKALQETWSCKLSPGHICYYKGEAVHEGRSLAGVLWERLKEGDSSMQESLSTGQISEI
jgi:hypothetical protein